MGVAVLRAVGSLLHAWFIYSEVMRYGFYILEKGIDV